VVIAKELSRHNLTNKAQQQQPLVLMPWWQYCWDGFWWIRSNKSSCLGTWYGGMCELIFPLELRMVRNKMSCCWMWPSTKMAWWGRGVCLHVKSNTAQDEILTKQTNLRTLHDFLVNYRLFTTKLGCPPLSLYNLYDAIGVFLDVRLVDGHSRLPTCWNCCIVIAWGNHEVLLWCWVLHSQSYSCLIGCGLHLIRCIQMSVWFGHLQCDWHYSSRPCKL